MKVISYKTIAELVEERGVKLVDRKISQNNLAREQLSPFVGIWRTSGQIHDIDTKPVISVSGTDIYEWLPGECFLLHRVDVIIGDNKVYNTEIIGWDYDTGKYFMHAYDALGIFSTMQAIVKGNEWVFEGPTEKFVGGFNKNKSVFLGVWYTREKGAEWRLWMDIKLEK